MTLSPKILDFIPLDFGDKKEREQLSFSPMRRRRRRQKGIYRRLRNCWKRFQLDGPRAKPVRVTFSMTEKTPNGCVCCFSFCWWVFIIFCWDRGADTRHSQVVCVTTALVLPFDNEISDDSHSAQLWSRWNTQEKRTICRTASTKLGNVRQRGELLMFWPRIVVLLGRRNTTTTMLFCAGLISK